MVFRETPVALLSSAMVAPFLEASLTSRFRWLMASSSWACRSLLVAWAAGMASSGCFIVLLGSWWGPFVQAPSVSTSSPTHGLQLICVAPIRARLVAFVGWG